MTKSTPVSTSSAVSPRFEWRAALLLAAVSAAAVTFVAWHGWTLWYGDGEAHQNIARRILDSRTPGYEQFGTVWLPLPHLLMLPFVQFTSLWRSGLGGAMAAAIGFVCGGLFLFHGLRRLFGAAPAWAGLLVWTLNPNLLFQQSIPMTEPVSLATVFALFWALTLLRDSDSYRSAVLAGVFATLGTMSRYEAWGLLPVAAVCVLVLSKQHRLWKTLVFAAVASIAPLYWLAHNYVLFSNALEFYNGYYSAKMIDQRFIDAGGYHYPGFHDIPKSFRYYREAARLCLGWTLFWGGLVGLIAAPFKRAGWAALLLFSLAAFYVASLYSSGAPIYVPTLWPFSHYNVRYGLNAMPFACFGIAAIVALVPQRFGRVAALLAVVLTVLPWALHPLSDSVLCWKESDLNSRDRRVWTSEAAAYLAPRYRLGEGILMPFGDLTGILRVAGISLREDLHEGNGPAWLAAVMRPDIALFEQ